jgi:cobalamin biosynthesis protein CobW
MRLLVQAVGDRVRHQYDRPWSGPRASRLVVIAEKGDLDPAQLRAALASAPAAP